MEEFLTSAILGGITYDIIKCGATLTLDSFKDKLKNWVIDEPTLVKLTSELNSLNLTDEMSALAIERKIAATSEISEILKTIKPASESNTIIQNHSGTGDNVGRDKIIHK